MNNFNSDTLKTKTFWTGAASLLGAVGGFYTGALPAAAAIQLGVTSVLGMCLRDGMVTHANAAAHKPRSVHK